MSYEVTFSTNPPISYEQLESIMVEIYDDGEFGMPIPAFETFTCHERGVFSVDAYDASDVRQSLRRRGIQFTDDGV